MRSRRDQKAGVCGIRTDWSGICGGPGGAARSGELLLQGLFGAQRALCGDGAALALESVATGQRHRALLATSHAALSLFPVHHLGETEGNINPSRRRTLTRPRDRATPTDNINNINANRDKQLFAIVDVCGPSQLPQLHYGSDKTIFSAGFSLNFIYSGYWPGFEA